MINWETAHNRVPELYSDWQSDVAEGDTLLGFGDWFFNKTEPGDTITIDGREILVQSIYYTDDFEIVIEGRFVDEDGSVDALAGISLP
jgi:hypothetical protein